VASNDETGTTTEVVEGSRSDRGSAVTSTKAGSGSGSGGSSGSTSSGGSQDPDVLVQEIEQTREDLADTLDAIVDRVSPKRVVDRTKQQAKSDAQDALQTVKESAASAAQTVKGAAASAADAVKEQVASVKERVSGGHDSDPAALTGSSAAVTAGAAVSSAGTPSSASSRRLSGAGSAEGVDDGPLPGSTLAGAAPLAGSPLPSDTVSLSAVEVGSEPSTTGKVPTGTTGRTGTTGAAGATSASNSTGTATSVVPTSFPSPVLPPAVASKAPLIAGASAAVAVLLLLLRRRRR
jgi:hypothetical protein